MRRRRYAPLYSSRRPRKRQVVNTIAGDIWSLGFSICNKAPVRDLDKILVPIYTDSSSQQAEVIHTDPTSVQELTPVIMGVVVDGVSGC